MSAKHVGNYEIVRLLARGGTGLVYLVRQPALDREVVLKRLDLMADDPVLAQRFVQEARVAAALDHPNVVTLFDFFEDDGVAYIAMEHVAGGSLRALVGRVRPAQIFGLAEGILAGLGHAERHGIAHRDLKPENVLLTRRGNVKIADFGIARAYTAVTQRLTVTGSAIGTPAYMAPEQALNERIGPYTDLYALGVIVYELIAGRPPFDADTPVGVLYCHVHTPPPPLRNADPDLGRWVGWLLEKNPADRPQSVADAWQALEESAVAKLGPYWRRAATVTFDEKPSDAEPPATTTEETRAGPPENDTIPLPKPTPIAPPRPSARPRRRRPAAIAAATVALLGGVAAAAALLTPGREEQRKQRAAPPRAAKPATAYDFDGDGRQELVVALPRGSARGSPVRSGVVLVHRGLRSRPQWAVITERRAEVPGKPLTRDEFGSGLASGDFDRDGNADLAIGTPGRDRVSVLYGADDGLLAGDREQFSGEKARLQDGAGRYGYILLAADFDGDRFDDLMVSAPGDRRFLPGTGGLHLLFGGRDGLDVRRPRRIGRPAKGLAGFGARLRAGNIDGDRRLDLVVGSPGRPPVLGHAFYCPGTRRGPGRCRRLAPDADSTTSSLAVADVDGDRRDDVVQGDAGLHLPFSAGAVRVWMGSRRGPRASPLRLAQNVRGIPGMDVPDDRFGEIVEAGYVDDDRYADMIVAAPGKNGGAGRIIVIRGGRAGIARTGHSAFGQGWRTVPGEATPDGGFGSALTLLRLSGDDRLDLAVAATGEDRADERVMIVRGGAGNFAPDENGTETLGGIGTRVTAPAGQRIRLARNASG